MDTETRGTGITKKQMESAPQDATFVWCNGSLSYPQALARHLERTDLNIVSPKWLRDWRRQQGQGKIELVVDRALHLTSRMHEGLDWVRMNNARYEL